MVPWPIALATTADCKDRVNAFAIAANSASFVDEALAERISIYASTRVHAELSAHRDSLILQLRAANRSS